VVTTVPGGKTEAILDIGPFLVFAADFSAIKDCPPLDSCAPLTKSS